MIEIKLEKDKLAKFKLVIDYLANLYVEVQFKFGKDGLKIAEIGQSNAIGVELNFKDSMFGGMSVSDDNKNLEFGLFIQKLKSALSRCKDEVNVSFGDQVIIKYGRKVFKLPVLELGNEREEFKMPELKDITTEFEIVASKIKEILEDSKELGGESILFTTKDKLLKYYSDDYNKNSSEEEIDISSDKESRSRFGYDLLSKLFLKTPTDNVTLGFGIDYPLKVVFEDDDFKMSCVLAPRVDRD